MTELAKHDRDIVFINQATGYITIDIINSFADNFNRVALIAGSIRVQDIELNKKVKWSKIIRYNRGHPGKKLLTWIIGTLQIFGLLIFTYKKYDVFYITIPPFAYLLSLILPNRFSILVFDVYPDVLKIYGIKRNGVIFRLWGRWNKRLFKMAYKIFTIGEGLAQLLTQYVERERVTIIPLWTGLTKAMPISKADNPWLSDLHLKDKFIIQYSGNIGYTHNVDVLVEIANQMKGDESCQFLIIGRGEKVQKIKDLIKRYELKNCILLPFQPDDSLVYSLAAADIGVVILDEAVADVSLPSKIYNLQAVGVPVIGISPVNSELHRHLELYGNGYCFSQSDLDGIKECIYTIKNNPRMQLEMVNKSLKAAENYTSKNAKAYFLAYTS